MSQERKVFKVLLLIGESTSGKSTIEKCLVEIYGYEKITSYTTRPPRDGEVNGIDYNFVSEYEFIELKSYGFFAESAVYNGWNYGTAKEDCTGNKVLVCTPHGLRQLKKVDGLDISSFYINVPRADRLAKAALTRKDVDEVIRRNLSDLGQYDGLSDEVDHVILNPSYDKSACDIAGYIHNIAILKECVC